MILSQPKVSQLESSYRHSLFALVRNNPGLMAALQAVAELKLDSWCIAAGAIRNLVWQHIFPQAPGAPASDLDVVYLTHATTPDQQTIETHLQSILPEFKWEVTNQALVHTWYKDHRGQAVAPILSLSQALARWPETATAVGIFLDCDGELKLIAPFGLGDLFAGILRHNSAGVDKSVFQARLKSKAFLQHWPELQLCCD